MSFSFIHLIIGIVLFFLLVNVYLRTVIIRKYKKLRDKGLYFEPGVLMNKGKRTAYIQENHPDHAAELEDFATSLNRLLRYVILGFLLLLSCFLYIYVKK